MPTPTRDLSTINPTQEIIVRAGNAKDPQVLKTFKTNYAKRDTIYPDVVGISVVFHQGDDITALALRNSFPHKKLSYATISAIIASLNHIGYGMILYITPIPNDIPDHHTLAVVHNGSIEATLPDAASQALIAILTVVDNPYQRP